MPSALFPWVIRDVSDAEKEHRRILLGRYGIYAQLSVLMPIAGYWLFHLGVWVFHERLRTRPEYSVVPGSPRHKKFVQTKAGRVRSAWKKFVWWMNGEIMGYAKKVHFIAGWLWLGWLLFLSVHRTGDDYFHVTKRFGIIAASQFPLHYSLIMKHRYSPLGIIFRTSQEELNPYHRTLGRVIYALLLLHSCFYWNYFIQKGLVTTKLAESVVLVGVIAFSVLNILMFSSGDPVREKNYRLFFFLHMSIGISIIPLLWFHAPSLRLYIVEALLLFFIDIGVRRSGFFVVPTNIKAVPHTNLLSLTVPIPENKRKQFKNAAGRYIYMQVPKPSRPENGAIAEICFNPFTIASVAEDTTSMQLVLRTLNGPASKMLRRLTKLPKTDPPLQIDGPYGNAARFPDFAHDYDRIVLIAGGVGATFILPLYRKIRAEIKKSEGSVNKVQMVWSMRSESESLWAKPSFDAPLSTLTEDEGIEVYVTSLENPRQPVNGSIELLDLAQEAVDAAVSNGSSNGAANGNSVLGKPGERRPDIKKIIDGAFKQGASERVAVIVCGPRGLGRAARKAVTPWVGKGREIFWHEEAFGW